MAHTSNNSSSHFLISSYSLGLCLYMDFLIDLAPSTSGILCTSLSFWLGGAHVGNVPLKTPQY